MTAKSPLKLDLGCGSNKLEGFTGVDFSADCGADIVHDLTKVPYPFESESVDEIHSAHFFEHLDGTQRIAFMEECWRILKMNARLDIITPYWTSVRASQDPTHKWPPISEMSYMYFNKEWRDLNKLQHYGIKCNFEFQFRFLLDADVNAMTEEQRQFAYKYYTNGIQDIHVTLYKKPV